MMERLALVLSICLLSLWKPCLASDPAVDASDGPHLVIKPVPDKEQRACTVDELLPRPCRGKSPEWSDDYIVEFPYNCTCPTMKARYFCPTQEDAAYPKWVPHAVASGSCTSVTREKLNGAPLPPKFKVLFYGNSHLRQVVEAMMCMCQGALTSKRVALGPLAVDTIVRSDSQCRSCFDVRKPDQISDLQESLLDNGCMAEGDTCRCSDDYGEFFFDNGAIAHYTFADKQDNKSLEDALAGHVNETLSSYDAVFMNEGNRPSFSSDLAVTTAIEVQNAGVQFFWLSTYRGGGGLNRWPKRDGERFAESGATFLDVRRIMLGMNAWTKGELEGSNDEHFCMPGPPNELALLLLKLMWAVHDGA